MIIKPRLKFRDDGTFRIVQFTDLHWKNGEQDDLHTYDLMLQVIQQEKPDFIMFTGDVIHSGHCHNPEESFKQAVRVAEEAQIPWAAIFGNHDAEEGITKERLIDIQVNSRYCLTEAGPSDIHGVGNYVLEVEGSQSSQIARLLYCFDTGGKPKGKPYDADWEWVDYSQIAWYASQAEGYKQAAAGLTIPSLAFLHIPIPEFIDLWDYEVCYGHNYEGVGCSYINSGLFAAFRSIGDVKGVLVGHNHMNDFYGELFGIQLCYGRLTGFHGYSNKDYSRGARMIRMREHEETFETWLRLEDGTKLDNPHRHEPLLTRVKRHE